MKILDKIFNDFKKEFAKYGIGDRQLKMIKNMIDFDDVSLQCMHTVYTDM